MSIQQEKGIGEMVNHFNVFISTYCGKLAPHLLDGDDNDGEEFRQKLQSYKEQVIKERDAELKRMIECKKRDYVTGGFDGEREMNIEIATYNEAITEVLSILNNK